MRNSEAYLKRNPTAEGTVTIYHVDGCLRYGIRKFVLDARNISVSPSGVLLCWIDFKPVNGIGVYGLQRSYKNTEWTSKFDEAVAMAEAQRDKEVRYALSRIGRLQKLDFRRDFEIKQSEENKSGTEKTDNA